MIDSAARAERFDPAPSGTPFFTWEVPQKPVALRLPFSVIDRLENETVENFRSLSSRGSEIGGILWGGLEPGDGLIVHVADYDLVVCEYSLGPLYRLAEADLSRLDRALAQRGGSGLRPVGFFRSHTRKGLFLDSDDLGVMESRFKEPHQVALVIRPYATKASTAGVFIHEAGGIHSEASYLEFPFRSSLLAPTRTITETIDAPPPAPVASAKPAVRAQIVPIASRRENAAPAPPAPPAALSAEAAAPAVPQPAQPAAVQPPANPPVMSAAPAVSTPPPTEVPEASKPAEAAKASVKPPVEPVAKAAIKTPAKVSAEPAAKPVVKVTPEPVAKATPKPTPEPQAKTPAKASVEPPAKAAAKSAAESPAKAAAAKVEVEAPAKAAAPPSAAVEERTPAAPSDTGDRPSRGPGKLIWFAIGTIFPLLLSGVLFIYPGVLRHSNLPAALSGVDSSPLQLRVERTGNELLLTWNRDSTAIRNATRAVLQISDGEQHENVDMDLAQLRNGSIVYLPLTADVVFKMEVSGKDLSKTTSESVRVLRTRPSPMEDDSSNSKAQAPAANQAAKPASTQPATTLATAPAGTVPGAPTAAATAAAQPGQPAAATVPGATPPPAATALKQFNTESLAQRLRPTRPDSIALPDAPTVGGESVASPSAALQFTAVNPALPPAPRKADAPNAPAPKQTPSATPTMGTGGNVEQAQLISRKDPEYPRIAREAGAKGTVELVATIGTNGRVKSVKAIHGHPLLQKAAIDAVMQWIYKPTTLNGKPVETQSTITLNFVSDH